MKRALLAALCLVAACERQAAGPGTAPGTLDLRAAVNSPTVATLVVEVTARDLTDPLIFNFTLVNGTATGTMLIPAGADRAIAIRAFDVGGIQTHEGSAEVDIRPGLNPVVMVNLRPRTGEQPIEIVLGSFQITVEPALALIAVGGKLQLAARVTDVDGTIVGGTADVMWASDLPAWATVDATGIVAAHLTGTARIVATYGGVGAAAQITVYGLEVSSSAFTGTRPAAAAAFGPPVSSLPGGALAGQLVFVGRGCPAGFPNPGTPEDPYLANPAGKIALIERGTCTFTSKVARAQAAGAIGVIVFNNVLGLTPMGGVDPSIVIPAVSVEMATGQLLLAGAAPVTVHVAPVPGVSAGSAGTASWTGRR